MLFVHTNDYGFFKPTDGATDSDNSYIRQSLVEKFGLEKGHKVEVQIYEQEDGNKEVKSIKILNKNA